MASWQPIETAPRGGDNILVYDRKFGRCVAYWTAWHDRINGRDREGWRTVRDWERLDEVTSWMPLPEPPTRPNTQTEQERP